MPELGKMSFIAHSLGGLLARYAIGKLYEPPQVEPKSSGADGFSDVHEEANMGTIARLQLVNFITFATPHCGSIGHKQLPFLFGFLFLEKQASQTDLKFISALQSFKRRLVYANTDYDHMVGWRTSSIRHWKELPQVDLLVKNDSYPHIVYIEPEKLEESPCEASSYTEDQIIDYEGEELLV